MIIESIKQGIRLTHKNWQVILLKMLVSIVNLVNFFIIVGIPVAISIFSLGLDIAHAQDILPSLLKNPIEIFSKYFGFAILIFVSIIVYVTVASFLILFVFGGMLGVLGNAAVDGQYKFSFSSFFEKAKKIFSPMLFLFSLAFLVIIGILILFGITAVVLISIVSTYNGLAATISVFAAYFFILLGITIILASIIFTAYAAISLVVENNKAVASFENAWNFIKINPMAFVFCIVLFIGIIAANFVLIALGASFSVHPTTGFLYIIPHRLVSYIVQSYLGMIMWGSLIAYYVKSIKYPVHPNHTTTYDI